MPWRNNGDYYSFKPDSIVQHAPTVSGVYGLFNFRHQIVIGSAANVRDALLHHRRHTKFRFSRFEPTGFTFEICPPERRENRTQELIKEYNPISSPQTPIGIAMLYRSWRAPEARAFKAEVTSEKKPASNKVVALPAKPAKAKAPLHLNAERLGLAGALCGMIFLAIGLIGLVPHLKNMFHSVVRNPTTIAESKRQIGDARSNWPKRKTSPPPKVPIIPLLPLRPAPRHSQPRSISTPKRPQARRQVRVPPQHKPPPLRPSQHQSLRL